MLSNPNLQVTKINGVNFNKWDGVGKSKLHLVNTMEEWKVLYSLLEEQDLVACDTETTGFEWYGNDHIVGLSFGWCDMHFYVACRHEESIQEGAPPPQVNFEDIKEDLIKFFSKPTRMTIWHNCLHAQSKVHLADGTTMRIDKMVKERHPGPVLCLNEHTGELESKPVVNWLKGDLRKNEDWVRIKYRSKGVVSCTREHEVLTDRGRKEAQSLCVGDRVVTTLPMFKQLASLLYGTLLGDSSIALQASAKAKTPHVTFAHTPKDLAFVEWKREKLASLQPTATKEIPNNRGFSTPDGTILKVHTACDPRLHDIFEVVTVRGVKTLNTEWITKLDVPAVALWYCDDGHLEGKFYPKITALVPQELRPNIKAQLDALGFSVSFSPAPGAVGMCRINLTKGSPDSVWAIFAPWIPQCMDRKVPDKYKHLTETQAWDLLDQKTYAEVVTGIEPLFQKNGRDGISRGFARAREYCISVEDNHNFFVNQGFCVSNCKFDYHFYKKEGIDFACKLHDTSTIWKLYDENAPGALKTIASGWRDSMGRWRKGVVDGAANLKETQISDWRSKEAKMRRDALRKMIMSEADLLEKDFAYQHMKRNDLKKYIATEVFGTHKYVKSGKEDIHYGMIPVWLMTEYAALDTFLTYKLYEYCVKHIEWTPGITSLYKNEMQLLLALFEAEEHGMRVDRKGLEAAGVELQAQIDMLDKKVRSILGENLNLRSLPQLIAALQAHGVELTKFTESTEDLEDDDEDKKYALDKKVLEKLKDRYEVVKDILELRAAQKTKGTYVDGILSKLNADNVLHCSFNQNVSTGRMSSNNPNLQNIPAKDKTIRKAFIPWSDEFVFVFADYSQIEIRLIADHSQDPLLLDAYAKNQDIHTRTCCEMFGYNIDEAMAILRDENHPKYREYSLFRGASKTINFGIIYGVGAPGLSEQIKRPDQYKDLDAEAWTAVCQSFIDKYLDTYIGVKRFINMSKRNVKNDKQVTNCFGRIRHLPHIDAVKIMEDDEVRWMQGKASRQGPNFEIQGGAADLFKIACVRIRNILKGKKSKLVNFVHDEVQLYMHKSELHLLPAIKRAMEDWKFSVPIIAEFSSSETSWGDKKSLKVEV